MTRTAKDQSERRQQIKALLLSTPDISLRQIAKVVGCSYQTVFTDLKIIGIEHRPRHRDTRPKDHDFYTRCSLANELAKQSGISDREIGKAIRPKPRSQPTVTLLLNNYRGSNELLKHVEEAIGRLAARKLALFFNTLGNSSSTASGAGASFASTYAAEFEDKEAAVNG